MSLFTFNELWSADCSEGFSAYSSNSVVAVNIDNSADDSIKFVAGSLSGNLRIVGHTNNYDNHNDTTASVLAELNVGNPILQVDAAIFVGGSSDLNLALLHPFKLGIYSVTKIPGQVEHGSQYKVTLLYEHQLKRHAYNMCCGPFGHGPSGGGTSKKGASTSKGRSFICVQALDGTLSFFEQELCTFSRYLPGALLPGPLAYAPTWDSFITVTSWNLVCFKYTSLAMAKDDPYQKQGQETAVGKRLTPDWSFSIGEEAIGDIQILSTNDPATSCVVICTFRSIMCFGDGGVLVWMKRVDHQICCLHSFLVPYTPNSNEHECISIATSCNEPYILYVYGGTTLKWAAKIPFPPVHLSRVFNYRGINGALLLMSAEGIVTVGFLGTVPSLFVAPPVEARDLDYEAAEKELSDLRKAITAAGDQEVTASKDATVEIKLQFEGQKTKWIESTGLDVISLVGVVKLTCHLKVNDVRVTFNTPNPIICVPDSVFVGDIIGKHSYQVEFYIEGEAMPSDLQCDVFVFYVNDDGSPHFAQKVGIRIPLFIVAKPHNRLEKEGDVKLTFSVNKPMVDLQSLYNDFHWSLDANVPGLSFKLSNNEVVSLLSSTKNTASDLSKYRIQSATLGGIYVIFKDFVDRVRLKHGREKHNEAALVVIEPLGLDEEMSLLNFYFDDIDAHVVQRQRDNQMKIEISDRAAQLRAVQRRLLIKFRDKSPTPLTQLEILFEGSLEQISDCLNFVDGNEQEMRKTECRLSGATKLFLELIKLKHNDTKEETKALFSAMNPDVWNFSEENGWEESVYTALNYIKGGIIVNQSLTNLDISKLKRTIRSAVEKAWKDAFHTAKPKGDENPQNNASTSKQSSMDHDNLMGNQIQERMTSARARTARTRMAPKLDVIPEPVGQEGEDETEAQKDADENAEVINNNENEDDYNFHHKKSKDRGDVESNGAYDYATSTTDTNKDHIIMKGKRLDNIENGKNGPTVDESDDNFW